ncbi:hypothetical protein U9M48_001584 [Paspalum notatum var. saurae]|uniref:Uncharacterized protein n=1 Tax=Paspalum notatum var. saurae TaxID=547442 RepID=A0AAQ3SD11_PASNO
MVSSSSEFCDHAWRFSGPSKSLILQVTVCSNASTRAGVDVSNKEMGGFGC